MATEDTTTERRKEVATKFFDDAWQQKKLNILPEILTEDYVDHNVANPEAPLEGLDEMRAYMESLGDSIPDKEKHIQNFVVGDDSVGDNCIVIHYVTTGTFANELKGYEPTGEELEVEGVMILRFEGEKIAEGWDISDTLSYWKQLGASVR